MGGGRGRGSASRRRLSCPAASGRWARGTSASRLVGPESAASDAVAGIRHPVSTSPCSLSHKCTVRRRTGKTLAEIASLPSSWASLDPGTIANSADPELLEHEPRWATESEHAEAPWRALRITPMYDFPRHEEGSWSDLIATAPNEGAPRAPLTSRRVREIPVDEN